MPTDRTPGRQTDVATSSTRRTWYGYGELARVEKSGFGRFLHDCSYVFGDVSFPLLPMLLVVMATPGRSGYGPTGAALVAWTTLVLVGTAIRGGWIVPLATTTPGWVAFKPVLVLLRIGYFNLTMAVAVFGGVAVASAVGVAPLSLAFAAFVSALSALAFPRVGESVYRRIRIL